MVDSPEETWHQDELILVLDLYVRHGKRPPREVRETLDAALRSWRQRGPTAGLDVTLEEKLLEFAGLDPKDPAPDQLDVGAPERALWDAFAADPARHRLAVQAARSRAFDVGAFLRSRKEPLEDPNTNARFRVVGCSADSVTYSRVRGTTKMATVAFAPLQAILDEVLERTYGPGWESFEVWVDVRFWLDHGRFADAVVAGIAGQHVFMDGMYNGVATRGSAASSEPMTDDGAGDLSDVTRRQSAKVGLSYLRADEFATVVGPDPFATDPDIVERGTRSHARLQNGLAAQLTASGLVPLSPAAGDPPFDLAWRDEGELHVAEVKSTTAANEEHQLRLGLGQLLRYRHALSAVGETVHATLYVERQPQDPQWRELCESLDVTLRWPEP